MLGIASVVVANGMIGIWVAASVAGMAIAIVHPAVSLYVWKCLAVMIVVAFTGLCTTPAALGLEHAVGVSLFSRDRDGVRGYSS